MKKHILPIICLGLVLAASAGAHVTVKPGSVGLGARQIFTVSVPTEGDHTTTGVSLVLPEGITTATPTVKPGWKIEVKTKTTGNKTTDHDGKEIDETIPTEIIWTGGTIPPGQRDEFTFGTQAPSTATTLTWKAYQTHSDGSIVSWDQTPGTDVKNPYSTTGVIDDLSNLPASQGDENEKDNTATKTNATLVMSIVAIALSAYAIARNR